MDAKHPCPDSALLAAFVDGTLEDYERTAVVSHLAECQSCRAAAVMVMEFQEVHERDHLWEPPAPVSSSPAVPARKFQTRGRWAVNKTSVLVWSMASAAAVVVLVVPPVLPQSTVREPAPLERLAAAAGSEHPLEARLSGGFHYRPRSAYDDRDPEMRGPWRLVSTAADVRAAYEDDPATSSRQAVGVAALLVGDFDDAIASLSMAAAMASHDAHVLNDLAGAYYERSQRTNRFDDLPRALSAAENAVAAAPTLSEAWFNRALIITGLGLRTEARQAWSKYLEQDSTSPWAAAARERLAALSSATNGETWPDLRRRLEMSPDQDAAEVAVRRYPSGAREYLDREVLPAWAATVEAGAPSDQHLQRARLVSDAFARVACDRIYADALNVIDRAMRGENSAALLELAAAHRVYAEGLGLSAASRFTEAAPILQHAEAGLRKAGSPLALRARVDVAGTEYYAGHLEQAYAPLAAVKAAARAAGYGSCLARAAWLQGLVAFLRYDFGEARLGYEEMLEVATTIDDGEQRAYAHVLLANLHWTLGDLSSAWRHRVAAAMGMEDVQNSQLVGNMLLSAAVDASAGGHHAAALVFLSARLGRDPSLPLVIKVHTLSQRARTLHQLGRHSEAIQDARLARERLSNVSDRNLYGRVEPDVLAADAEVFKQSDPLRAVAAAERALTLQAVQADPLRVARFNLALAEASMAQGALDRADQAVQQGITALEKFRALPAAELRIGASDPSWSLFVKAMQIALLRGDPVGAFEYSERRRIQNSFEQRGWGNEVLSVAEVQRRMPGDTAMIVMNQLDDQLQVWVIRRDRTRSHAVSIGSARAGVLVTSHLQEIIRGMPAPRASGELFDEIIRPVLSALVGMRNVVIVADAPYQAVAFAGLWDRKRNRYLVEDHAIVAAPSATAYAWSLARARSLASNESRDAVVFESPGDHLNTASESVLGGERGLASVYARADFRRGDAATGTGFLDEARRREVVHVAAPLAANAEFPFLSRLLLADAPGRKYSGAVFARQVADADLSRAKLVALDARGQHAAASGESGTVGLTRALLAAGVPNIIGPVVEVRASGIDHTWLNFHRHYAGGLPVAESLRQAQLVALNESNHRPGPWAMLTVFGSTR